MRREHAAPSGLTPRELARLLRVSPDRIRAIIARGELRAVNMAPTRCGRPRWVILPDALAAFLAGRLASPPPAPAKRRKRTVMVDYYPD
jgi:excisionase family DNA binding protein